jgi:twitching motility protein PilI
MDHIARESAAPGTEVAKADAGLQRTRLREFQTQLVQRMQAAQSGAAVSSNQLGVMVGQVRYLLELKEAGEIVTVAHMAGVPLTRSWYRGLSNIRGNLTSVVDLACFQGHAVTPIDSNCRVVAFASSLAFNSGLLVSQVLGLRNSSEMEELVPESADGQPEHKLWANRRYRDKDGNIWTALSLAELVQDQEFLQIGLY